MLNFGNGGPCAQDIEQGLNCGRKDELCSENVRHFAVSNLLKLGQERTSFDTHEGTINFFI